MADLNILIKAVDDASGQIKQVNDSLQGMTNVSGKTSDALVLTGTKMAGMGFALRAVMPNMQDWSRLLDSNVSGLDKFTNSLGGLNSGLDVLAMQNAKSMKQMLGWMGMLSAGFGILNFGIGKMQAYNDVNRTADELNKAMQTDMWATNKASVALAEAWIAQTEALGNLTPELQTQIDSLKEWIKATEMPGYLNQLAASFDILTEEEDRQYKQQQAIIKFMNQSGVTWDEAVAKVNELAAAYQKAGVNSEKAQESWKKLRDVLGLYTDSQKQADQVNQSYTDYMRLTGMTLEDVNEQISKQAEAYNKLQAQIASMTPAEKGGGGGGWGDLSRATAQYSEAELARWQGMFGEKWQQAITAYGISGQNKMAPEEVSARPNWQVYVQVDGRTIAEAMVGPLGEMVAQRQETGG